MADDKHDDLVRDLVRDLALLAQTIDRPASHERLATAVMDEESKPPLNSVPTG